MNKEKDKICISILKDKEELKKKHIRKKVISLNNTDTTLSNNTVLTDNTLNTSNNYNNININNNLLNNNINNINNNIQGIMSHNISPDTAANTGDVAEILSNIDSEISDIPNDDLNAENYDNINRKDFSDFQSNKKFTDAPAFIPRSDNPHAQPRKLKLEKYTPEYIAEALYNHNGLIGQTALFLGVSRMALDRYIKRQNSEILNNAIFQGKEEFLDECEKVLQNHVRSLDPRISLDAVKYALSNIGKDRGYTTAHSLDIDANIAAFAPDISKVAELSKTLENVIDIEAEED